MTKATGPLFAVHFRRRREGKTDYAKRLALLKSERTRMVVRKTNKYVIVQFAKFDAKGDQVITSVTSKQLDKVGFKGKSNTPSAYLTGALAAKQAKEKGVKSFILDMGLQAPTKGNLIFAALKGAIDAGLEAPFDESVVPSADRIAGKHLKPEVQKEFGAAKAKILEK